MTISHEYIFIMTKLLDYSLIFMFFCMPLVIVSQSPNFQDHKHGTDAHCLRDKILMYQKRGTAGSSEIRIFRLSPN